MVSKRCMFLDLQLASWGTMMFNKSPCGVADVGIVYVWDVIMSETDAMLAIYAGLKLLSVNSTFR